jgi:outer membrane biosynthesis protein TonB
LEPKAPPLSRNRVAAVFAALGLLVPTLAISLVFLGLPGTTAAAEPQPDAAPQAPAVAPDPAPEARNTTPPQQSAPTPPVQAVPQVPAVTQQPATPAPTPSTTTPRQTSPKPKVESKPARVRREAPTSRPERRAEPADPGRLLRVDAFLPGVQGNEDSPSHLVLLAAGALLALLMASGSLLSVARREWPRQLR